MTSGRVQGGFNQFGFTVGILMLDTQFPRIPGDMGNASTFPFPVRYQRVEGASPDLVVRRGAAGLLPAFVDGAQRLEHEGAGAITTNCGFLVQFQREQIPQRKHAGQPAVVEHQQVAHTRLLHAPQADVVRVTYVGDHPAGAHDGADWRVRGVDTGCHAT